MAFVNEKTKQRTIDYERNAILVLEDSTREDFCKFRLDWNAAVIKFLGQYNCTKHNGSGLIVNWKIYEVDNSPDAGEARNIIVEALQEYGIRHMKKGVEKVNVIFDI